MYCTFHYLFSWKLIEGVQRSLTFSLFSADTCYEGDIRLSNGSRLTYPDGYQESSGRVEVCVDGEYIDVCPGSVDVQQVCSYLGYTGILLHNRKHNNSTNYCKTPVV